MLSNRYIWLIWSLITAEFGLCSVLSSTEKIVGYYSDQSAYKNPLLPYRYVNYSSSDQSYLILNAQAPNDGYVYEYDVSIVQNGPVQLGFIHFDICSNRTNSDCVDLIIRNGGANEFKLYGLNTYYVDIDIDLNEIILNGAFFVPKGSFVFLRQFNGSVAGQTIFFTNQSSRFSFSDRPIRFVPNRIELLNQSRDELDFLRIFLLSYSYCDKADLDKSIRNGLFSAESSKVFANFALKSFPSSQKLDLRDFFQLVIKGFSIDLYEKRISDDYHSNLVDCLFKCNSYSLEENYCAYDSASHKIECICQMNKKLNGACRFELYNRLSMDLSDRNEHLCMTYVNYADLETRYLCECSARQKSNSSGEDSLRICNYTTSEQLTRKYMSTTVKSTTRVASNKKTSKMLPTIITSVKKLTTTNKSSSNKLALSTLTKSSTKKASTTDKPIETSSPSIGTKIKSTASTEPETTTAKSSSITNEADSPETIITSSLSTSIKTSTTIATEPETTTTTTKTNKSSSLSTEPQTTSATTTTTKFSSTKTSTTMATEPQTTTTTTTTAKASSTTKPREAESQETIITSSSTSKTMASSTELQTTTAATKLTSTLSTTKLSTDMDPISVKIETSTVDLTKHVNWPPEKHKTIANVSNSLTSTSVTTKKAIRLTTKMLMKLNGTQSTSALYAKFNEPMNVSTKQTIFFVVLGALSLTTVLICSTRLNRDILKRSIANRFGPE